MHIILLILCTLYCYSEHILAKNLSDDVFGVLLTDNKTAKPVEIPKSIFLAPPMLGRATPADVVLTLQIGTIESLQLSIYVCEENINMKNRLLSDDTIGHCSNIFVNGKDDFPPLTSKQHNLLFHHTEAHSKQTNEFPYPDGILSRASWAHILSNGNNIIEMKRKQFLELSIQELNPNTNYLYLLRGYNSTRTTTATTVVPSSAYNNYNHHNIAIEYTGRFSTPPAWTPLSNNVIQDEFTFDIIADSHLFSKQFTWDVFPWDKAAWENIGIQTEQYMVNTINNMNNDRASFYIQLGDPFDLHGLGFMPIINYQQAQIAHVMAREQLSNINKCGAAYHVLGNWEGEGGCFPEVYRKAAATARKQYMINPKPNEQAYKEFGSRSSSDEDYYSFEWGHLALFIVLNVKGYTPTCHQMEGLLESEMKGYESIDKRKRRHGTPSDFTLGEEQREYLVNILENSYTKRGSTNNNKNRYKFRFIVIHHAVAGNGGDASNSQYGRGGHRTINIGEQKWLHAIMKKYHVQGFFYGHDHIFVDEEVDGIRYILTGTSSAPWLFDKDTHGYDRYYKERGHSRITVNEKITTVEFVSLNNTVIHTSEMKAMEINTKPNMTIDTVYDHLVIPPVVNMNDDNKNQNKENQNKKNQNKKTKNAHIGVNDVPLSLVYMVLGPIVVGGFIVILYRCSTSTSINTGKNR